MNFSLHTAVLAGLTLTLVAMIALGFYWLATKGRSPRSHSPFVLPPVRAATVQRPASDIDEHDEWEAFASYSDHALCTAHKASAEPPDIHSPFGRPDEATPAPFTPDVRRDVHDAFEPLMSAAVKLEPAPAKHPPNQASHRPSRCCVARSACPHVSIRATALVRRAAPLAVSQEPPVVWRRRLPARKPAPL